jgi:hypothetical protein
MGISTFTVTNPEFVRLYRKYVALVPCTYPELKKYYKLKPEKSKQQYKKCYSDFETDVTRRM